MPELAATVLAQQRQQEQEAYYSIITVDAQVSYAHLASYMPVVGDVVLTIRGINGGLFILGKLNGPGVDTGPAWQALTLTNGWGNYGAGFATAAYRKVGDEVQLRGLLTGFGTLSPFTLPVGYRPLATYMGATLSGPPSQANRIDIPSTGVARIDLAVPSGSGFLSLDSLRFSTA